MTSQTLNFIAAWTGALAGLGIMPLPHEAMPAAVTVFLLLVHLGRRVRLGLSTPALCGLLGLACTRLTVSLVY